jgi:hypothetical protein
MSQIVAFTRQFGFAVEDELTGEFKALITQPERRDEMPHRQFQGMIPDDPGLQDSDGKRAERNAGSDPTVQGT